MTKKEYLQNKGLLPQDLGVMYIVASTRAGVSMKVVDIWEVKDSVITYYDNIIGEENVKAKIYTFKEAPFELTIQEDRTYGEDHGYGTGSGDLWGWSYFGSLDKAVAEQILHDEKIRVASKYQLNF